MKKQSISPIIGILPQLPTTPGVYQFLNAKRDILYIGKAKNIRKRVSQHFQKGKNVPSKNIKMLALVQDIQWTQTDTEVEALVLENTLIKEHRPKYNILLRDDKNFLYIKITTSDEFPQILTVRRITDNKNTYFGPYTQSGQVRSILQFLGKLFPYECLTFSKKGITKTPCFNYHIHRCPGLCIGAISSQEYRKIIDQICYYLKGNIEEIIKNLEIRMKEYSQQRAFEKAAEMRDRIMGLTTMMQQQKVVDPQQTVAQDVIAYTAIGGHMYVTIFKVRDRKLKGQENYTFDIPQHNVFTSSDIVASIIQEYYDYSTDIPSQIVATDIDTDNKGILEIWLRNKKNSKVSIIIPERGKKYFLLELCQKNVEGFADKESVHQASMQGISPITGVKELQRILQLSDDPKRIECYDISHLGGKFTVASMVVFIDGIPSKKEYRQFKMNTIGDAIDDYQSLRETLERRLKYLVHPLLRKMIKNKKESFLRTPDLIILDGGKGQLSVGVQVLSKLDLLHKIPIIGIAKEQEDIFIPSDKNPITIPKDSQAQYLLERIRDEAHRFANSFHKQLRDKEQTHSRLDDIDGIGSVLKKKLLTKFGSLKNIQAATEQNLSLIVGKKLAKKIKDVV